MSVSQVTLLNFSQSDRGATPLFYAMCENDKDLVDLLLKYGARVDIGMQAENEVRNA